MIADASASLVVVVDEQPTFMKAIPNAAAIVRRTEFLLQCAALLEIPILATEQVPDRMGGTDSSLRPYLPDAAIFAKSSFSCCGSSGFTDALEAEGRGQVILVGVETHICVCQTALDLSREGFEVFAAADAISCRDSIAHQVGLNRMAMSGITVTHTESVVYEWLQSAEHPKFKDVLKVVKEFSGPQP